MYELKVEGMTCGGCASRVTKAIKSIDSNANVDVELRSKTVRVTTSADVATLVSAVTDAGYPASTSASTSTSTNA